MNASQVGSIHYACSNWEQLAECHTAKAWIVCERATYSCPCENTQIHTDVLEALTLRFVNFHGESQPDWELQAGQGEVEIPSCEDSLHRCRK